MKKLILLLTSCFFYFLSFAQEAIYTTTELRNIARDIKSEALQLYTSEHASWHGTDLFLTKYPIDSIGGYFSYPDGLYTKCVFYSKDSIPVVIGAVIFNENPDDKGVLELFRRSFNALEYKYYLLRKAAKQVISNDTFYAYYKNTGFNIVPIIKGDEYKVYVITSAETSGLIFYGNDYLLDFNAEFKLISQKALHKGLIRVEYPSSQDSTIGQLHNHLPGYSPFITPTDICTNMLYYPLSGYNQQVVVSEKYISIWSFKQKSLVIIPKKSTSTHK